MASLIEALRMPTSLAQFRLPIFFSGRMKQLFTSLSEKLVCVSLMPGSAIRVLRANCEKVSSDRSPPPAGTRLRRRSRGSSPLPAARRPPLRTCARTPGCGARCRRAQHSRSRQLRILGQAPGPALLRSRDSRTYPHRRRGPQRRRGHAPDGFFRVARDRLAVRAHVVGRGFAPAHDDVDGSR